MCVLAILSTHLHVTRPKASLVYGTIHLTNLLPIIVSINTELITDQIVGLSLFICPNSYTYHIMSYTSSPNGVPHPPNTVIAT